MNQRSTTLPGLSPDAATSFLRFLEQERVSRSMNPGLSMASDPCYHLRAPPRTGPIPECVRVYGYCDCSYHKTAAWLNEYYPIEERADKLAEWSAWHTAQRLDSCGRRAAAKAQILAEYVQVFEVALGVVGYAMDMTGPEIMEWKEVTRATWQAQLEGWVEREEMARYDRCNRRA
ncbi:hypothetical protein MD484_g7085, partial [Candolleomyces efflorescens]